MVIISESDITDPVSLEDIDNDNDEESFPSNPATPSDDVYQNTQNRVCTTKIILKFVG